ncbi:MAG: enoyl-CoA hydratase/isomerase family protein [Microscillaceae bacterium]|nr:enoyl-CoA hydratase/isomerase family protein [Microscillaceae bacterium]
METLQISYQKEYAIVQLDRGKVNPINHQMVQEIRSTFQELATNEQVRGVIITGKPNYFSAGLDVIELYGYDEVKIRQFFFDFGSMYVDLAKFPKPLICAITGHSPAGGCVIAITADYRIMAEGEKYTIGLNEVAVNIQISDNIVEGYAFWIGRGKAHKYLLEGKLLPVQEAHAVNLLDEVCPLEEVLPRAEKKMKQYLFANNDILLNTKYKLRKSWLEKLDVNVEKDFEEALITWWKPEIRMRLKMFVESLSKK